MLTRAFAVKPRWNPNPRDVDNIISCKLGSILEYSEDCLVGFVDDLPLIFCGQNKESDHQLTLREVLRASVSVLGESRLGMTDKVVLLEGKLFAVKRFRRVSVGRREFSKRVERFAQISHKCNYLVPVTAYLYAKRIKLVLCHYFPMGSLADLLSGGREFGHTALDWNQRLMIAIDIASAIAFIHTSCPPYEKNMQMNVHGNIKASNVMINSNFTACLSDYGSSQLVEFEKISDIYQQKSSQQHLLENNYKWCQKNDIYNFGIILLDMLGGYTCSGSSLSSNSGSDLDLIQQIIERKDEIKRVEIEFFEFSVEGKERYQALKVLDLALACADKLSEARPSIEQILKVFGDVINVIKK